MTVPGFFRREFWVADDELSASLDLVDRELDEQEALARQAGVVPGLRPESRFWQSVAELAMVVAVGLALVAAVVAR